MPVNIYSCPVEVPVPKIDYDNYEHKKAIENENAHKEALKAHLVKLGYKGKNTGKIYQEQIADGYALYMVCEGPKAFALVHLPYGDGYHGRDVQYLPKKVVLERIAALERLAEIFRWKP